MADKIPDTASLPAGGAPGNGKVKNAQGKWVFAKGNHVSGSRKGRPNKATREVVEFCMKFLLSPAYRESATARVLAGTAPHLETLWHHYAAGKPADELNLTADRPPFMLILGPRRDPLALPEEPLALPPAADP